MLAQSIEPQQVLAGSSILRQCQSPQGDIYLTPYRWSDLWDFE